MSDTNTIRKRHCGGFVELDEFWAKLDNLETALVDFSATTLSFVEEPTERVIDKIRSFEPSVSVIGQIKAGKSTLLNALIGESGFLPSDVNPWTSVITALHINSRHRPLNTRALFRFFDQHEWDRLVATGGRLGEMADRAGFESEADEVRAQVTEMRQTTEARLGSEFEKLLGSSHAFPDLDKATIDRYICYGDPDDMESGSTEGVYADLTKSADLYFDLPGLPKGLCLRDTPGVNDTFMMREQITLNAISDSRVCVIVLSAHQALSTMDVALLRIICSVEAREVLIFVNRIDELTDPAGEQKKIRASIRKTLSRLGVDGDIEILFGSGYWANCALGDITKMVPASRNALATLHPDADLSDPEVLRGLAMDSSGVYDLNKAIAKRVVEGPGKAILKDVRGEIDSIIEMSETVESVADNRDKGLIRVDMSPIQLSMKIADVREEALKSFDTSAEKLRADLRERLNRAQETFVRSAIDALQSHIDAFGEFSSWEHDPSSLRMMMKTAFSSHCAKLRRQGEASFDVVLGGIQDLLQRDLGVYRNGRSIEFPEQPQHKAPTVLARTLSLDLQGPWWRKFWKFGDKSATEKRYKSLILAETTPLIEDLITDFFDPAVKRTRDIIESFAMDQGNFCKAILERLEDGTAARVWDNDLRKQSA